MAENTNTEREATGPAEAWLRSRYGAYRGHFAWRELEEAFNAGRASLSLPAAGQEPVAWMVPKLQTFKGATRVHFTRAPGCTMTDAELMDDLEGRVMWLPQSFSDCPDGVVDKFGVKHFPKPLYAAPQPAVAAGWPLIARALDEWHEDDGPVMWWAWNGNASGWAGEPAWCGTPLSSDWPGYHTHWTPHPTFPPAPSTEGESNG